jgi:arylsulfatase A-like enzyme
MPQFVLILLITLAALAERPNIVIIVADDLGWADVGYHGSSIPTPHIDSLCKAGIELDRHYVTPLCTPTRVCLLTGRYSSRFGNVAPSNARVLPWGTPTLASLLKQAGYHTAIVGKWHLGSLPKWGPHHFGFERSYGSLAGGVGPYNHLYKKGPYQITWHRNQKLIEEKGHVTDLLAREAVEIIAGADDKPFFLYVPFTAPHDPFDEPAEYIQRVAHLDAGRQQYAASVCHMDAGVGRIVDALKANGHYANSIILFFSDNGGTRGEGGQAYSGKVAFSAVQGKNTPLRDGKRSVYEGGVRTPACVVWPGHLTAGRKLATPLHATDWLPTLIGATGMEIRGNLRLDGTDVLPLLRGRKALAPRAIYCKSIRGQYSLHHGDWKLVVQGKAQELYNLATDPNETQDLRNSQPERLAALAELLTVAQAADDDAKPDRGND